MPRNLNALVADYKKLQQDVATKEFYTRVDLTNHVNTYSCENGHMTKTIDRDAGVTPMFIGCPKCGQTASSKFYKDSTPDVEPSHEWFRPSLEECKKMMGKEEPMLDHILKGGLELREIKPNVETPPTYEQEERLDGFSIERKSSTNIDYFGSNRAADQMFFQFRNGTTYIYDGVPVDVMKAASGCESIGKFFYAYVKGKYESAGIAEKLVREDHNV